VTAPARSSRSPRRTSITRASSRLPGLYLGAQPLSGRGGQLPAGRTSTQAVGVLMLQDIATVKVQVEVQEKHIALVRLGSTAGSSWTPTPTASSSARHAHRPRPRPRTRTLGVEMEIANPEQLLKPGMYARVELLIARHPGAILVQSEPSPTRVTPRRLRTSGLTASSASARSRRARRGHARGGDDRGSREARRSSSTQELVREGQKCARSEEVACDTFLALRNAIAS